MRYAKYKQTGIEWLPQVPAEWEVKQLRNFLRLISIKNHPDQQLLSVTREQGVIVRNVTDKEENHNFIPEDLSNYKYVQVGDFVINKMKSWQGSYGVSEYEGIVSPAYYVCKVMGVFKKFFSIAIRSKPYVAYFASYSKGIRVDQWDLSPIALKAIPFLLPPLAEQEKIVKYLDEKCGKIDEAVNAKEREVELLKECKQSLIAEAVTKGVQGKRKMKQTGIEWLPQVPAEWEVRRISWLMREKPAISAPSEELLSVFLNKGVVRFVDESERRANTTSASLVKYQLVEPGDFVLNNQQAWRGSVGVSKYRGIVSPAYFVMCLSKHWDVAFANYFLRSKPIVSLYVRCSRGVGSIQRNLIWDMIKAMKVALPPLEEQDKIVKYLDEKCGKIDEAVKAKEREVELLKELKQSVIAEAVTGQRKVA